MKIRIVAYNAENECEKQDGVAPASLIYCGAISDVTEDVLTEACINYSIFFDMLKDAKENGDFCFIQKIS